MDVDRFVVNRHGEVDIDLFGETSNPRNKTADNPSAALVHCDVDRLVDVRGQADAHRVELVGRSADHKRCLLVLQIGFVLPNHNDRVVPRQSADVEADHADVARDLPVVRSAVGEVDRNREQQDQRGYRDRGGDTNTASVHGILGGGEIAAIIGTLSNNAVYLAGLEPLSCKRFQRRIIAGDSVSRNRARRAAPGVGNTLRDLPRRARSRRSVDCVVPTRRTP